MSIATSHTDNGIVCDRCHKHVSIYHLPCLGKNTKPLCDNHIHLCIICNARVGLTYLLCTACSRDNKIDTVCQ